MTTYYPPKHQEKQYHCVYCGVFSAQHWFELLQRSQGGFLTYPDLEYCVCSHCRGRSIWFKGVMLVPSEAPVPPAHANLPESCRIDYEEARAIVAKSPRAAAALLRLVVQKLMIEFGEKGKNINEDIAALVLKGLPAVVQQALDFCRVVGNNSVHPGEIELNDTPEVAHSLFSMVNFIVEDRIARPKQIESLYGALPEAARQAIEARDAKKA
jgi:hypothetical protein